MIEQDITNEQDGWMNKNKLAMGVIAALGIFSASANAYTVEQDDAYYTVSVAPVAGFVYDFTYTADFTAFKNANQTHISAINFKIDGGPGLVDAEVRSAPVDNGAADPADYWNVILNDNISGSNLGCEDAKGGKDFVCSGIQLANSGNWIPPTLPNDPAAGPVYEWIIRVTFAAALTEALVTQDDNPIRAQFVKWDCKEVKEPKVSGRGSRVSPAAVPAEECEWKGAGQMSLEGPFEWDDDDSGGDDDVPEPGTLGLMGMALLGMGLARRRSRVSI